MLTRGMFMARSGNKAKFFLLGLALLLGVGCARNSAPVSEEVCDSSHLRILQAVLDDDALKNYANAYFKNEKDLKLIWDDAPSDARSCKAEKFTFVLTKSSALPVGSSNQYVVVTKLYFDDAAAFVEIRLSPTGMNGDFFLRNNGGWKVAQRTLWEN